MLSFLLRLGENRIEQLEKQDILDNKLKSLNCFYTVRNLFLFERAVQVQMSKKMYDNVNPLSIYDATKENMEWVDKHQQSLETILNTEDSTKTICNNLSAYIKKMKDLKS